MEAASEGEAELAVEGSREAVEQGVEHEKELDEHLKQQAEDCSRPQQPNSCGVLGVRGRRRRTPLPSASDSVTKGSGLRG